MAKRQMLPAGKPSSPGKGLRASLYRARSAVRDFTLRQHDPASRANSKAAAGPAISDGRRRETNAAPTVVSDRGWGRQSECDGGYMQSFHPGPEKMLMLAILEDAVICFQKFSASRDIYHKTIFRDARNWLWSDRADWPFAYRNVCDVLGIDANYLRQGLTRRQESPRLAKITRDRVIPRGSPPIDHGWR